MISKASLTRQTSPLPPFDTAAIVSASASALQLLRHHNSMGTGRLAVASSSAEQAGLQGCTYAAPHAAVQGILKCLPFELPSLQVVVLRTDGAQPQAAVDAMWAAPSQAGLEAYHADLYGCDVRAGIVSQPRMQYRHAQLCRRDACQPGRRPNVSSGSCVITGALPLSSGQEMHGCAADSSHS